MDPASEKNKAGISQNGSAGSKTFAKRSVQDKSLPAAEAEVTYVFIAARSTSRPNPASVLAIPAIGKQPPAPSTLQSGTSAMVGKEVGEGREKEIVSWPILLKIQHSEGKLSR